MNIKCCNLQVSNLLLDDQTAVGELEGNSFSVGNAPKTLKSDSSTVVQLKKKERERERDKKKGSKEIL